MDKLEKELMKYEGREVDRKKFLDLFESYNNSESDFMYCFTEYEDSDFLVKAYGEDDPRLHDFKERLESGEWSDVDDIPYPHMIFYASMYFDEDEGEWVLGDLYVLKLYETGCSCRSRPRESGIMTEGERECVLRVLNRVLA